LGKSLVFPVFFSFFFATCNYNKSAKFYFKGDGHACKMSIHGIYHRMQM